MKRLTCITFEGWNGVASGLQSTVKTLGYGSVHLVNNTPVGVSNALKALNKENPEILILGGYGKLFQELIRIRARTTKVIVKWSSNVLQSELTNELEPLSQMLSLLKEGRYFGLGINHEPSVWGLKNLYPDLNIFYMPEVPVLKTEAPPKLLLDTKKFQLDVICTADARKNIYNQLLALHNLGAVHVNYARKDYASLASTFPSVQNHGRLPDGQYDRLIASVDLGCQVSANESYNYVAAEHMAYGVPMLGSRFVPALMDCKDADIHKYLIVEQMDSAQEIHEKAKYLRDNRSLLKELGSKCKEEIRISASHRAQQLTNLFANF